MRIAILPAASAMPEFRQLVMHITAALVLLGCAASGPPLNSDLIERRYGSYGVEIRDADGEHRVASLYSGSAGNEITRTYAVTEFLAPERAEYRAEHGRVIAGASIGSSFRSAGWEIRKQSLFIGELEVPESYSTIARLMNIELPETLAVHEYLFIVSREERSWSYAKIIEVHHPDFLGVADLKAYYGEILFDDSNRDRIHDFLGPPPGK